MHPLEALVALVYYSNLFWVISTLSIGVVVSAIGIVKRKWIACLAGGCICLIPVTSVFIKNMAGQNAKATIEQSRKITQLTPFPVNYPRTLLVSSSDFGNYSSYYSIYRYFDQVIIRDQDTVDVYTIKKINPIKCQTSYNDLLFLAISGEHDYINQFCVDHVIRNYSDIDDIDSVIISNGDSSHIAVGTGLNVVKRSLEISIRLSNREYIIDYFQSSSVNKRETIWSPFPSSHKQTHVPNGGKILYDHLRNPGSWPIHIHR
jgi:hypothetical protein